MGSVTLRRKSKGMEFHTGEVFGRFPRDFQSALGHIAAMEETKMTQVIMTTEGATLTMQLFPLSPDAVRRLRGPEKVTDTKAIEPSKNN